jgi:hypothetical protein
MRTIRSLFFVVLSFLVFTGCKKDSNNQPAENSITAKVDGASWSATSVAGTLSTDDFTLTGTNNTGTVNLTVSDFAGEGIYSISFSTVAVYSNAATPIESWPSTGVNGGGRIEVTSLQGRRIAGTFNFASNNGSSTKTITEGVFDVTIPE